MKNLLFTTVLIALIATGTYVFAHGMGNGHYGNGHHEMMGMGGCNHEMMDDVQMNVEKNKNGITIKMTSKEQKQIELLHQHASFMEKHHQTR